MSFQVQDVLKDVSNVFILYKNIYLLGNISIISKINLHINQHNVKTNELKTVCVRVIYLCKTLVITIRVAQPSACDICINNELTCSAGSFSSFRNALNAL